MNYVENLLKLDGTKVNLGHLKPRYPYGGGALCRNVLPNHRTRAGEPSVEAHQYGCSDEGTDEGPIIAARRSENLPSRPATLGPQKNADAPGRRFVYRNARVAAGSRPRGAATRCSSRLRGAAAGASRAACGRADVALAGHGPTARAQAGGHPRESRACRRAAAVGLGRQHPRELQLGAGDALPLQPLRHDPPRLPAQEAAAQPVLGPAHVLVIRGRRRGDGRAADSARSGWDRCDAAGRKAAGRKGAGKGEHWHARVGAESGAR
jgi:hypothetical protein